MDLGSISIIDIGFIIIIVIAAIRGAFRGFVAEFLSMAAIIIAGVGAIFLSKNIAPLLQSIWGESVWNQIVAFLILFLVFYLVVKLLEVILHRLFEFLHLQKLDRVMGFLLGIVEGVLITVIGIFLLSWQPFFEAEEILTKSVLTQLLLPILPPTSIIPLPKVIIGDV